jgi:U3 small nucleolar RNA-associated protein 10
LVFEFFLSEENGFLGASYAHLFKVLSDEFAKMSALQKQLAAIAATSSKQLDLKAQRAAHGQSLLFPARVAVSQDFETIYHICLEGFEELCALDSRFNVFANSLFGEESKSQDRGQMTLDQIKELDVVIQRFLGLASSSVLLKPTQKAVEWLIRRFR